MKTLCVGQSLILVKTDPLILGVINVYAQTQDCHWQSCELHGENHWHFVWGPK
jgi:hypothetical protein